VSCYFHGRRLVITCHVAVDFGELSTTSWSIRFRIWTSTISPSWLYRKLNVFLLATIAFVWSRHAFGTDFSLANFYPSSIYAPNEPFCLRFDLEIYTSISIAPPTKTSNPHHSKSLFFISLTWYHPHTQLVVSRVIFNTNSLRCCFRFLNSPWRSR